MTTRPLTTSVLSLMEFLLTHRMEFFAEFSPIHRMEGFTDLLTELLAKIKTAKPFF